MYNSQYEERVQDLDLHQVICSILVSICESNLKKDKIKEHIIRLFGGISRTLIDSMQEEIKFINEKLDEVKVEKSKIGAKLNQKTADLANLQDQYTNLKYNYENLKNNENRKLLDEPYETINTLVPSQISENRNQYEKHKINSTTK